MITSPEEFRQRLLDIQNSVNVVYTTLPSDEPRFIIDANSRTITIPVEFQFLGVKNDHNAETIYFEIDRYFDDEDLSQHTCVVQFSNKNNSNDGGVYPVTTMDTTSVHGKIIFGWEIKSDATSLVGDIYFSVRFYSINSTDYVFTYNFNTLTAKSVILDTLDVDNQMIIENYPSELDAWLDRMNELEAGTSGKVEEIEAKGQEVLTEINSVKVSIPEDYSTLSSDVSELKNDLGQVLPKSIELYNLSDKIELGRNSSDLYRADGYVSATKNTSDDDFPLKIKNENFSNLYIQNATNIYKVFFYSDDIWGTGYISDIEIGIFPVKLDIPQGTNIIGFYSNGEKGSSVSINLNIFYEDSNEHKINNVAYYKRIITSTDDWDSITDNGIYAVVSLPDKISSVFAEHNIANAGRLTVQNGVASQANAITQIYTDGLGYSQLYRIGSIINDEYKFDNWVLMFDSKNTPPIDKVSKNTVYYSLGDSITAGAFSTSDGEGHAVNDADWAYGKQIANSVGCDFHNLAHCGDSLVLGIKEQSLKVGNDATLVTVSGGANDYYLENNMLGTISDEEGANTVYGALKAIVHNIASIAPKARIVLISPMIIKYGSATIDTKWSREYRYSNFNYDELNKAYKDVADLYNVEYIDGTTNGSTNIFNIESVQFDGVHPSKEYYSTIANWLKSKLF